MSIIHKKNQLQGYDSFTKVDFKLLKITREEVVKIRNDYCDKLGIRREGLGKSQAIYIVLLHVLNSLPQMYIDKQFYLSMFLFMLHTGQRFITMSNIQLKDIKRIDCLKNGKAIVLIEANRTKGNSNWQHPFSIKGKLNENTTIMNIVFWLNQCLILQHGLDLNYFKNWNLDKKKESNFLWGSKIKKFSEKISHPTCYWKFREFCENSGIPEKQLSLHSLRAGFFCSAYLKAA